VLLEENMSSRRLAARLQSAGHSPILASDLDLVSIADARVLAWAVAQACPVLTRDHEDLTALHELVVAVSDHHPGILVVRFDNDPGHNLTERTIAIAIGNLQSSGVVVANGIHVLNHCR
jgi:hypothetical protein